jgi:phosphoglucomutase
VSPAAGKPPDPAILVDVGGLLDAYYDLLAISEEVCRYRAWQGIDGPLFLGRDTHALSEPAFRTTLEVLAGHGVGVFIDAVDGYTPTPVISHQILTHNAGTPSLRTTNTSSGASSFAATSNATGTPPRGSPSTTTSSRPAYSPSRPASSRPASVLSVKRRSSTAR